MNLHADTLVADAADGGAALLAELVAEGLRCGASTVHLADGELRFRIGGKLGEARRFAGEIDGIESGIRRIEGRDVRIAAMPGRIVLHLGAAEPCAEALEALGMRPRQVQALVAAFSPGLILAAGPAGSGKSRTLAALTEHLDDGTRCVLSAEGGWSAILQQDPDVIVAGRIDSREGACKAVQAAEAGHLVLAEVEAVDALGAIAVLRALRIEAFRLATTLQAVVAQRLVERLCPACRAPVQARGSVSALLGFETGSVVYEPAGCAACGDSGFAGKTGVFEVIRADPAIRRLINDGGDGAILARHAFLNARNLGSAARVLAREGVITPDEAVRISRGTP